MNTKTNHLKIGVFVITGLIILIAALFAFGARTWFEERMTFESYIEGDVEGLSLGSPVLLRGVAIGKVTRISFTWNTYPADHEGHVLVEFEIPRSQNPLRTDQPLREVLDKQIQRGLRARVKSQGITGTSVMALDYLDPVENPVMKVSWTPRHPYVPSAPSQFGQILNSIERSLQNIEKVNLGATMQRMDNVLIAVDGLLSNVTAVVRHVEQVNFRQIGTNATGLVTELRTTNQKLQGFLDTTRDTIKDADLAGLSRHGQSLVGRLTETAERLNAVIAGLDTADLNQTLVNTRAATGELDAVLRELKQYPSGFLFGKPPAPARSVERSSRK